MAAYAQPGTKRQKVREVRSENVDYFQGKLLRSFENYAGKERLFESNGELQR